MTSRSEKFTVEKSLPGGRLDTFLREKFPAASRGAMQRLIEQGHILLNGQPTKPRTLRAPAKKLKSAGRMRGPPRRSRRKSRWIFYLRTNPC